MPANSGSSDGRNVSTSKSEGYRINMKPDPELSSDQKFLVDQLSESEIELIDSKLLEMSGINWRKVARVVGMFMQDQQSDFQNLPDVFLAQRVYALAESGSLDFQGSLGYMQCCEVRLAAYDNAAH